MPLRLRIGCKTSAGIKPVNEDAVGAEVPDSEYTLESRGAICALADGVSSAEAGKEASEYTIEHFINGYFKTPETWSVEHSGQQLLTASNIKLFKRSHEFAQEEKGYLCTFSGLIIKSRTAHIFHAGDSRIYHIHNDNIHQLSHDHVVAIGQGHRILSRALGMDSHVTVDYSKLPVSVGDRFVLTSDGVHDFLSKDQIREISLLADDAATAAKQLHDKAMDLGSDDNVSAIVVLINDLPEVTLEDYNNELTRLPFPPDLSAGSWIDDFEVIEELFASPRSQLYLVKDPCPGQQQGQRIVMKTPSRNFEEDIGYIDRFIQEEWIGKRINSPHVVKVLEQSHPRNYLYYLMEFIPGLSLDKWMKKNRFPKPKMAIDVVKQIAAGLSALHRQDTIHQDLKPANILLTPDGLIKLVDFGSVYVAGVAEVFRPLEHEGALGTAAYSDPQYLLGRNTGLQGDLYALATITYEIFTGELPYGEQINECHSAFDYDRLRYRSAAQFNPVIPLWFDRALEKGVAFDPEKRYSCLTALLKDLQTPNADFLRNDPRLGDDRSPRIFWQILSGFWVIILLLVIILFTFQGE
jgi:serine/threonine protein kinase